jgi:hypothetical protein
MICHYCDEEFKDDSPRCFYFNDGGEAVFCSSPCQGKYASENNLEFAEMDEEVVNGDGLYREGYVMCESVKGEVEEGIFSPFLQENGMEDMEDAKKMVENFFADRGSSSYGNGDNPKTVKIPCPKEAISIIVGEEEKEISLCKNYRHGEWRFWLVSK